MIDMIDTIFGFFYGRAADQLAPQYGQYQGVVKNIHFPSFLTVLH